MGGWRDHSPVDVWMEERKKKGRKKNTSGKNGRCQRINYKRPGIWIWSPLSTAFLEFSCFLDDPADVGILISGSSAFYKTSLNIWKLTVHISLNPGLEEFEHYFTSVWDECDCAIVWAFFGIVFLWDWNENWPFPVLWPLLSFPNLLAYWVQHFHSIIFRDLK